MSAGPGEDALLEECWRNMTICDKENTFPMIFTDGAVPKDTPAPAAPEVPPPAPRGFAFGVAAPTSNSELPHITSENAERFPPPDLRKFKKRSRGPRSAPALWFRQMTGEEWKGSDKEHRYVLGKNRWRHMTEDKLREKEREAARDRSDRIRPEDDNERRVREKRELRARRRAERAE